MTKEKFKTRLEIAKKKISDNENKNNDKKASLLGIAFKMSTELVAAVLVGSIIGFIFDTWFGTKPWLILTFFFVGVVAGVLNVVRSAKNMQK
tara:strand:+ start:576 stop:851 length:276 start_codon:yes stop_codon:yes gene_type:complete